MALRPVVQIEIPLAERAGSIIQRETLAPFPERHHADYWSFDRHPFGHLRSWAAAGSPPALKLPPGAPAPAAPRPPAAAAAPRAPARGRAAGMPETLGWAWTVITVPINPEEAVPCVTTPSIPWPFRIVGFTVNAKVVDDHLIMQLWDTDHDVGIQILKNNPYPPLLPLLQTTDLSILTDGWGWQLTNSLTAHGFHSMAMATSILGNTVLEAGRRVTIGCKGRNTDGADVSGTITVERADVAVSVQADVRPIMVRMPAPARAPAPPRPPARVFGGPPRIIGAWSGGQAHFAGPAKKMMIFGR